jgi:AraC family transcriptional regulator of adaptative response/methylated-DNA-[protein]-cysteine methyltransferase
MTTNAILNVETEIDMALKPQDKWWEAVVARDATHDGKFYFGVSSTGVYCRPSCAARRPRREPVTLAT